MIERVPSKTLYHWCNVAITRVVAKDISSGSLLNRFHISSLVKFYSLEDHYTLIGFDGLKLRKHYVRLLLFNFHINSIVDNWNSLPREVQSSCNLSMALLRTSNGFSLFLLYFYSCCREL